MILKFFLLDSYIRNESEGFMYASIMDSTDSKKPYNQKPCFLLVTYRHGRHFKVLKVNNLKVN